MLHQLSFNIFTSTFPSPTLLYLLARCYDLITTKDVGAQLHNTRNSPFNCLFLFFSLQFEFYILPSEKGKSCEQYDFIQRNKTYLNAFQQEMSKHTGIL